MIRVLVAEDSHAARLLLVSLLASDPEIEVVGEVGDGEAAVAGAKRLRPDVITMDIQMPLLDGLEATARIMNEAPTPIVVVSSSVNAKDVASSFEAIKAGALVALPKPGLGGGRQGEDDRRTFVSTVKAMAHVKVVRRWSAASGTPPFVARAQAPQTGRPAATRQPSLIAIAASTGGPAALQAVLSTLPSTFPVPIVIVQHIAHGFLAGFAQWLNSECALAVKVAAASEPLTPGTVYLAPDDAHLGVTAGRKTASLPGGRVNGFRPSGSVLFESAADAYGSSLVAVILTGMGADGVSGLRRVRAKGGYVIAQDEASSLIYGMPGEAVAAGLVDISLPLSLIGQHLQHLAG
jgi:two-component system, chemotaxis family, protein-glutamate methylesterase/glutaminase